MVIILNARAGSAARNPGKTRSKVAALFGELGAHPQIIVAEGKDVGAIVRQAVVGNEETIVAGGGDGTVSTVAAEVSRHRNNIRRVAARDVQSFCQGSANSVPSRGRGARTGRPSRRRGGCRGSERSGFCQQFGSRNLS